MWGKKSPLSSEPTTPTGTSKAFYNPNEAEILSNNPLFDPLLPKQPLSSEPTTPIINSNPFINPNEPVSLNKNPRNLQKPPKSPLSSEPTTPTVMSNASYNPNKPNLNPNPNPVTFHKELPKDFLNAMKKHGRLVNAAGNPTIGAGRRRTTYKRAKKRSFKSRKKSKVIV